MQIDLSPDHIDIILAEAGAAAKRLQRRLGLPVRDREDIRQDLLVDLLRQELGYQGLIVSDNASMIGFVVHAGPEDRIVETIAAGIDVYLNADPEHDHERLVRGVMAGRLSEEQVYASARRVLEMKARLRLYEDPFGPMPTSAEKSTFKVTAQAMADKSITLLRRDGPGKPNLKEGAKVLTVTYAKLMEMMGQPDLEIFDQELSKHGFQVTHLLNPNSDELRRLADEHDAVFINLYITPMMSLGTVRMTDTFRTWGWRSSSMHTCCGRRSQSCTEGIARACGPASRCSRRYSPSPSS